MPLQCEAAGDLTNCGAHPEFLRKGGSNHLIAQRFFVDRDRVIIEGKDEKDPFLKAAQVINGGRRLSAYADYMRSRPSGFVIDLISFLKGLPSRNERVLSVKKMPQRALARLYGSSY
jgi:hypothetical protein